MEMSRKDEREALETVQASLGYRFRNSKLLFQALTHRSYAHENPDKVLNHNERFEFLGDAVLNTVVSHLIMKEFSDRSEGDLTKTRALIVNEKALARVARRLVLGRFVFLGRGENQTGGREKTSILANCYEAVVGAVYLDGGYEAVSEMIRMHFSEALGGVEKRDSRRDFKSLLQELTQREHQAIPRYALLNESGPDHEKRFRIQVSVQGVTMGHGEGKTKKEAEQQAAQEALDRLKEA